LETFHIIEMGRDKKVILSKINDFIEQHIDAVFVKE